MNETGLLTLTTASPGVDTNGLTSSTLNALQFLIMVTTCPPCAAGTAGDSDDARSDPKALRDPAHRHRRLRPYDTPGVARGVTVVGSYAYVADGNFGLQVIDVSNPATTGSDVRFSINASMSALKR